MRHLPLPAVLAAIVIALALVPSAPVRADDGVPKPGSKPMAAPGTAQAPECAWVGERVVMALMRDDVIAADGFLRFYRSFGCPVGHLGRAFGCAVPFAGEDAKGTESRVRACWRNPAPDSVGMPPDTVVNPPAPQGKPAKPAGEDGKAPAPESKPAQKPAPRAEGKPDAKPESASTGQSESPSAYPKK